MRQVTKLTSPAWKLADRTIRYWRFSNNAKPTSWRLWSGQRCPARPGRGLRRRSGVRGNDRFKSVRQLRWL